jgi:hypothetical protein
LVVEVKPTPKTPEQTAEEQREREQEARDRMMTQALSGLTVFIIFLQAGITVIQVRVGKQQRAIMRGQEAAAKTQSQLLQDQLDANKVIERAYVTVDPITYRFDNNDERTAHFVIKNHGRTPGTVTNVVMAEYIQEPGEDLPNPNDLEKLVAPEYLTAGRVQPGEEQFLDMPPFPTPGHIDPAKIRGGEIPIWLVGFADYIDEFGVRHRSGFARKYAARRPAAKNLTIESRAGFHYDRRRARGEGIDWD